MAEEPRKKPELWRYRQAKTLLSGEYVPGEPAPAMWTSREELLNILNKEKGGIERLTPFSRLEWPPDVAMYRYRDHEGQWRYFFICREGS